MTRRPAQTTRRVAGWPGFHWYPIAARDGLALRVRCAASWLRDLEESPHRGLPAARPSCFSTARPGRPCRGRHEAARTLRGAVGIMAGGGVKNDERRGLLLEVRITAAARAELKKRVRRRRLVAGSVLRAPNNLHTTTTSPPPPPFSLYPPPPPPALPPTPFPAPSLYPPLPLPRTTLPSEPRKSQPQPPSSHPLPHSPSPPVTDTQWAPRAAREAMVLRRDEGVRGRDVVRPAGRRAARSRAPGHNGYVELSFVVGGGRGEPAGRAGPGRRVPGRGGSTAMRGNGQIARRRDAQVGNWTAQTRTRNRRSRDMILDPERGRAAKDERTAGDDAPRQSGPVPRTGRTCACQRELDDLSPLNHCRRRNRPHGRPARSRSCQRNRRDLPSRRRRTGR